MDNFKAHETAVIDPGCIIGEGTQIWHFSHIMTGSKLGMNCNIGQNVVVSPGVILESLNDLLLKKSHDFAPVLIGRVKKGDRGSTNDIRRLRW